MKLFAVVLFFVIISLAGCQEHDSTNPPGNTPDSVNIKSTVLKDGLSYPWEILWGPDNFIWMTERDGRISRVDPATGTLTPLITISDVQSINEGGLLGMVLHPEFNTHPYVYVSYNYDNGSGYKEKIVRFTYNGTTLTSPLILVDGIGAASYHDGSRLLIHDNKLYFSTGDAGIASAPQDKTALNGKINRINLDGTIPPDNPFPGNRTWTFGHRNPQGLVFANGILYSSEHGPTSDDEINIIERGRNYGWPDMTGYCDEPTELSFCAANNVKEPITAWTPTLAVSGLDYYDKSLIPQWKNCLLVCTLKAARLVQLKLSTDHRTITGTKDYFIDDYGRMRDLCISPAGKVYICTSNGNNDKIIEVNVE